MQADTPEGQNAGRCTSLPVHNPPGEDMTHGQDTEDEDLGMAALFQEPQDVTHGQDTEDEDLGMAALFQEMERPGPSDPTEVAAISPTTRKKRSHKEPDRMTGHGRRMIGTK